MHLSVTEEQDKVCVGVRTCVCVSVRACVRVCLCVCWKKRYSNLVFSHTLTFNFVDVSPVFIFSFTF